KPALKFQSYCCDSSSAAYQSYSPFHGQKGLGGKFINGGKGGVIFLFRELFFKNPIKLSKTFPTHQNFQQQKPKRCPGRRRGGQRDSHSLVPHTSTVLKGYCLRLSPLGVPQLDKRRLQPFQSLTRPWYW